MIFHLCLVIFRTAEDPRWSNADTFKSINNKVKFLMDRKAEEGAALLSIWFIVHRLTPLGTKSQAMQEFIAQTIKVSNPWKYFNDTLFCPQILVSSLSSFCACQKLKACCRLVHLSSTVTMHCY